MSHPEDKPTQLPVDLGDDELQSVSRYQQHRRPQWNMSNESSPSIAERRVAPGDPGQPVPGPQPDGNIEEEYDFVESCRDSTSNPPSDSTGSDNTIIGRAQPGTGRFVMGIDLSLTEGNMEIHNMEKPLGTMTTYEWVHGRRCPGDLDIKDISSRESMKVRRGCSQASRSTVGGDEEFGVINHPSGTFLAGAGGWADVRALPCSLDKVLHI